ncbi:UDP-N-acetylglucosamine 2-epimerase [Flavobacterium ardleyense]|uniref:UDP-N-acetylglucosamine 2-epimerase n=1 Tax=Flavobacterium ardleyense TaxID=2038737 RepID=UPI00298D4519|nr:UDP-N-acetylglucosamine 2-epimerase [Flavobacterium ardleyense]
MTKKILFISGTRADFGKIKSLIKIVEGDSQFETTVFVTGMHLQEKYGYTLLEFEKCGITNIHTFENHTDETTMDLTLAKTIQGLSEYVQNSKPDLIVIHGDRVEALAGAIVGSLNNILVAHIEGGEISGTIDELIRHSTSKMSHIHFTSNDLAKKRLIQMGEIEESIFTIGSPDVDIMFSESLPSLEVAKEYYDIHYAKYAIVMFHPVTTEHDEMQKYAEDFVEALLLDDQNYVVIYPNNDLGSSLIFEAYEQLRGSSRFKVIPSLRFEYFLTLLENADFIVGNSSAGIREAPYYGIPIINVGSRQQNRSQHPSILNVGYNKFDIYEALQEKKVKTAITTTDNFGDGNSAEAFLEALQSDGLWEVNRQKQFRDI